MKKVNNVDFHPKKDSLLACLTCTYVQYIRRKKTIILLNWCMSCFWCIRMKKLIGVHKRGGFKLELYINTFNQRAALFLICFAVYDRLRFYNTKLIELLGNFMSFDISFIIVDEIGRISETFHLKREMLPITSTLKANRGCVQCRSKRGNTWNRNGELEKRKI